MQTLLKILLGLSLVGGVAAPAFAAQSGGRKKIISAEKSGKSKKGARTTNIDFDAVDISGERKAPAGSSIMQTRGEKDGSLVKIRYDWRQEMIQSASGL